MADAAKKTLELEIRLAAESAAAQIKSFSADIRAAAAHAKSFTGSGSSATSAIKQMQAESARAAKSFKSFGMSTEELKGLQSQLKSASIDLSRQGIAPQSSEVQKLAAHYRQLESASQSVASQQEALSGGLEQVKKQMTQLAPVVAAVAFDKSLGDMAKSALGVSDTFRGVREDFGIMLGDMEAGAGLFDELQEFNFWTPFDLEQTAQAAKVLRTAKVELSDLTQYLTRFGDLAQGSNQRFQSFISAFSKASAKGKADMEVLNVYIDQGVQILDALAAQMGVTSAEIVKMASAGEISFSALDKAIATLTSEGGQYYGSMEAASQRLSAVQAGLQESVKSLAASIGDMLAPAVSKSLELMTSLVDTINDSPLLKGALVGAVAAIATAINVKMISALVSFIAKMWASYAATMAQATAMSALNPLMIAAVAAVGVATAAYVAYAASQQKAAEETNAAALAIARQREELEGLSEYLKGASDEQLNFNTTNMERELLDLQRQLDEVYEKQRRIASGDYSDYKFSVASSGNVSESDDSSGLASQAAELESKIAELTKTIQIYKDVMHDRSAASEMEAANAALQHRNELYQKTTEYQREQLEKELEFARSLYSLQTRNGNGTYSGFDTAKTDAIIRHLEKQLDGLGKKGAEWTTEWQDKFRTATEKIKDEWDKAVADLEKKGRAVFGEGFVDRTEYQSELEYLNKYFHEQMDKMREEGKVGVTFSASAGDAAIGAMGGAGEIGSVLQQGAAGYASGVGAAAAGTGAAAAAGGLIGIIIAFIEALADAIGKLENGSKALNFATTIIGKAFDIIGPLVNDALAPAAELFETLGDTIGKVLRPFAAIAALIAQLEPVMKVVTRLLESIGIIFDALYQVLKPFFELIVTVFNAFTKVLNLLGVKRKELSISLDETASDIKDSGDELQEAIDSVTAALEKKQDEIRDLLNAQISSLKSQYELGLITRDQYNTKASQYTSAAQSKLDEISKLLEEVRNADVSTIDGIRQAAQEICGSIESNSNLSSSDSSRAWWKALLDPFDLILHDTGTVNIPQDHIAMVHKGETIIPRTFAEGIRSGELALVGGGRSGTGGGSTVYVSVNVDGSVVSERQLVDAVYDGISRGIRSGERSPLPAA